jgi:phage recombination protein Bet
MAGEMVKYRATDGVDVELTPEKVVGLIATGGAEPDPRDVAVFIAKCQARGLNPLAGDCYMTTYKSKQTGRVTSSVVVSKDYYMRTAYAQPTYRGFKAGIIVNNNGQMIYREGAMVIKGEQILGGWAEVHDERLSNPVHVEVSFDEYDTGASLWADKPATMIRKVALVQALREAYPNAYAGVYDSSEVPEPQEIHVMESEG